MKNNKLISLLLSIFMLFTCFTTFAPVLAEIDDTSSNTDSNGMHVAKTAVKNDDDTYTITLEAYATGSKVITEVSKDVPTDIVLVLDQSGSMAKNMETYSFRPYTDKTNSDYYSYSSNEGSNNLYYKQGDGSYASVSVSIVNQEMKVDKTLDIDNCYNNSSKDNKTNLWDNRDSLYVLVNGEFKKVTVSREREWIWGSGYQYTTYTYSVDNAVIATGERNNGTPSWTESNVSHDNKFYIRSIDSSKNVYSYTYTDATGKQITIGNSTGDETQPKFEFELYERYSTGNVTRLDALKSAVTTFTDSVAEKAKGKDGKPGTDDDINHRVAVVGFANYSNNNFYDNTEIFIGATGYKYGKAAEGQYANALQSMNTSDGVSNVAASIGALSADGATYVDLGIEMANGIFNKNPIDSEEKRNRVVVVFTDGVPGYSGAYKGESYESEGGNAQAVADAAIEQVKVTKNIHKATVYTVGIFEGADATSAGNSSGNDTQKANYFMQNLSSNNGNVQNPSYYLSASDSASLSTIFKQISENIESGGSTTTLNSEAVVKDIISPQFELPERTTASDITVETYKCTGKGSNGYTWEKNDGAMGATASINDDQVSVTGFDFAENYVGTVANTNNGTSYRGNKLVIRFTVKAKDGFLGGNNVDTNVSADIYENASATKPVVTFNRPQVNVPIKEISITPSDKNVYLLGSLTGKQLKEGSTVKCGDVILDLTKDNYNYGLESWQTDYVNITTTVKDLNGTPVTDKISDLKGDTTYSIEVKISPKYDGIGASGDPVKPQSNFGQGNINVYKPFVTVSDSIAYYGDTAPTDFSSNRTIDWKHGDNVADTKNMGNAPDLSLKYDHVGTDVISNGKINTKNDIPVDITSKIGDVDVTEFTTFTHTDCKNITDTGLDNHQFWIHVKTCNLTISKTGGSVDETYVFKIKKDGSDYTEVSITGNDTVTINELPVGEYTVEEDTAWSWRYSEPTITYSSPNTFATLTSTKPKDTVSVTNNRKSQNWLNGFSTVVQNIFGKAKN